MQAMSRTRAVLYIFLCVGANGAVPGALLNNGVKMPKVAIAPMNINASGELIGTILDSGMTHIFTAEDYYNQAGIKAGLAGRSRSSYFLTSMTSPCIHSASKPKRNVSDPDACYKLTKEEFQGQLDALGVEYVDLMMLHGPSRPFGFQGPCGHDDLNTAQWRAYADMYKAGKAKAIGVSNYCVSCFPALLKEGPVPAVNQIQFHAGMGPNPEELVSFMAEHKIVLQAYSPLAQGALVSNKEAVAAGGAHNKTGAQAALRWITQHSATFVTDASSAKHLADDADVFDWSLTDAEMKTLDALNCKTNPELCKEHAGTPSWGCTQLSSIQV